MGSGRRPEARLAARRAERQRRGDDGRGDHRGSVGILSQPQAGIADFYREMGDLFVVEPAPHNRWAGAKVLRDCWQTISTPHCRDPC
jgi:hypothetical protein